MTGKMSRHTARQKLS